MRGAESCAMVAMPFCLLHPWPSCTANTIALQHTYADRTTDCGKGRCLLWLSELLRNLSLKRTQLCSRCFSTRVLQMDRPDSSLRS